MLGLLMGYAVKRKGGLRKSVDEVIRASLTALIANNK
jgi:Arc/MetJ-type ribon-helix-helix transcriptional regulator